MFRDITIMFCDMMGSVLFDHDEIAECFNFVYHETRKQNKISFSSDFQN